MTDTVNHPKHYTAGYPEVIDIIDAWGLAADYYAGNVLKYFMRAPLKGSEEEDYRKAMWYLDKIYDRDIGVYCDILYHHRVQCSPIRLRSAKLNLNWFKPLDFESEITLREVVNGWGLSDDRENFIRNFHYQNFDCEKCIRILDKLIDNIAGDPDEEL